MNEKITVEVFVNREVEDVWEAFTVPEHVTQWNFASDDWCSPSATNDLTKGGKFSYRMEAKDGSFGFDFEGIYDEIKLHEHIAYTLLDDRKVTIDFKSFDEGTLVTEVFEAESQNPLDLQKNGWQAILDNFKKHAESHV